MEPVSMGLGIASILGNLFGNLFGASKASSAARDASTAQAKATERAAVLQKQAIDDALAYQKQVDARDYRDWLTRESRDRTDWEASEQRKAPYRALGDSAVRTLADYIKVPGMQAAQEVPVQQWRDPYAQPMPQVGDRTWGNYSPGQDGTFAGRVESGTMPVGGNLRAYAQAQPGEPLLQQYGRRTLRDLTTV